MDVGNVAGVGDDVAVGGGEVGEGEAE